MYGYATDETEEMMPLTIMLAHKMNQQLARYRRDGTLPWVRPDSKTQVLEGGREGGGERKEGERLRKREREREGKREKEGKRERD